MSIVGTRPPLIGEVSEYELHHRARLAIKPGITGMWQVSGRSDITDFEEVVELDKEYIENYIASESTFYRVLREEKMLNHRGRSEAPKKNRPSTYHATASNQVYMWDITYLNGPHKGMFYYLYGN